MNKKKFRKEIEEAYKRVNRLDSNNFRGILEEAKKIAMINKEYSKLISLRDREKEMDNAKGGDNAIEKLFLVAGHKLILERDRFKKLTKAKQKEVIHARKELDKFSPQNKLSKAYNKAIESMTGKYCDYCINKEVKKIEEKFYREDEKKNKK